MAALYSKTLRLWAMLKKEFILIKRDPITYIFLLMVPFLQVIFFGFIINSDAKNLPAVVVSHDSSQFTNSLISAFKNTGYFRIINVTNDDEVGSEFLRSGKATFVINIPPNFSRDLVRNKNPEVLIEGDASDPIAVVNAFQASSSLVNRALTHDLQGELQYLLPKSPAFTISTHAVYNPAVLSAYHSLPGLLTTILTLTLVMITAISVTTEYEQGTMESLLITPVRPLEVIAGKIIPQAALGYALFFLTIAVSYWLFKVPFYGSLTLLTILALPFIVANLALGLAVSTLSKTQLRAANIANSYTLPATLLSGFLFPFYAMPLWAQWVGNLFPPAHFLRITSGIMLKGVGFKEVWSDVWPILVFMVVIVFISIKFYRKTLD